MEQPNIKQAVPLNNPPAFGPLPPKLEGEGTKTIETPPKQKRKWKKRAKFYCTAMVAICAVIGVVTQPQVQAEVRQLKWWLTDHKPVVKTGPFIPIKGTEKSKNKK